MVTLTDSAANKVKELLNGQGSDPEAGLRLAVRGGGCSGFQYALAFDQLRDGDQIFEFADIRVLAGADCSRWPEAQDALINALRLDRNECVRVEAALASAPIRIAETFRHARCSSSPMEPRGVMASLDPVDGVLTVWASTQSPHIAYAVRRALSKRAEKNSANSLSKRATG